MGYDVDLVQDGQLVEVESFTDGGTYAIGGSTDASLNITYNYSPRYREVMDGQGLREFLHGKRAADVMPGLEMAVRALGTECSDDYWAPTPGNAGHALNVLLGWARQYPDAVFEVS